MRHLKLKILNASPMRFIRCAILISDIPEYESCPGLQSPEGALVHTFGVPALSIYSALNQACHGYDLLLLLGRTSLPLTRGYAVDDRIWELLFGFWSYPAQRLYAFGRCYPRMYKLRQ
jgi:hypothetical protein